MDIYIEREGGGRGRDRDRDRATHSVCERETVRERKRQVQSQRAIESVYERERGRERERDRQTLRVCVRETVRERERQKHSKCVWERDSERETHTHANAHFKLTWFVIIMSAYVHLWFKHAILETLSYMGSEFVVCWWKRWPHTHWTKQVSLVSDLVNAPTRLVNYMLSISLKN